MNFANKISTFRILTVPFFVGCLVYYDYPQEDYLRFVALGIFILGVISDAVDGYIARKAKQISKAGMILDPLGDKLLLMSAFISLAIIKDFPNHIRFPLWVTLVVISRDVLILMGAMLIYMLKQTINIVPTKWGKFTTTFQMLSVIAVLVQFKYAYIFWTIAVAFTLVSGMDYVKRGFKSLYAMDNFRNHH